MASQYRDVFCDETHEDFLRTGGTAMAMSMKPIPRPLPFGVFSAVPEWLRRSLVEFTQIAADARRDGRINKSVFTGPTYL
jgi:hypothetical protein